MPKLNLYRNISITFIIFVAVLLGAIFLFFSSKATIVITPNPQKISLGFNLEAKEQPSADELTEKDIVSGKLESYVKKGHITGEVLSTKTVDSEVVGQVKLINESSKNQSLVKTTQLQAENGVIVRTSSSVVVPAGGSLNVSVVAKDPAEFKNVELGKLVIIKLNPDLQTKIYGLAEKTLSNDPHEIKVLAESDIARAKEKLSAQLIEEVKKENNISTNNGLIVQIKNFTTDYKLGEEIENFNLEMEVEIKALKIKDEEFASLILKKIANLNLSGLSIGEVKVSEVEYTILDDDLDGNVLVKVNYFLLASIDEHHALLNKSTLVGQKITTVKDLLGNQEIISHVEILASPYWTKSLPRQENKINIIIK